MPVEVVKKSSSSKKDTKRWIQGIASTDHKDLQGEKVLQNGIELDYFLKHGFINDDHKPGPEHKVGEPTEARLTKAGLWIKSFLYKGHDRADEWWKLMNSLENSDARRKVGFSIQGKVMRREGSSIMKCWLQDVAITASPVNTHTWAEIVKALHTEKWCSHPWRTVEKACKGCKGCPGKGACGSQNLGPPGEILSKEEEEAKALSAGGMGGTLVPQSLEGKAKVQTFKSFNRGEAITYLRLCKGYSQHTAEVVADSIFARSGLLTK